MNQSNVFVSHSSQDSQFCSHLVTGLTKAGADVWYDQQALRTGQLTTVITSELESRPIFVVVLSKAAFASEWVTRECLWAYNLYNRKPERVILPVTAQQIDQNDFDALLFMEEFKRIEGPGGAPLPTQEAIAKTLHALALDAGSQVTVAQMDVTAGDGAVLWVDDTPSNNFHERRYLERLGIAVTISTSTDDALGKLIRYKYAAVISDMGRPGDQQAGYTLLEWVRKIGVHTPFILYTSSRQRQYVAEAQRRGALGQTNNPEELIDLVRHALRNG